MPDYKKIIFGQPAKVETWEVSDELNAPKADQLKNCIAELDEICLAHDGVPVGMPLQKFNGHILYYASTLHLVGCVVVENMYLDTFNTRHTTIMFREDLRPEALIDAFAKVYTGDKAQVREEKMKKPETPDLTRY